MKRYFFLFLLVFVVVSVELPSAQETTIEKTHPLELSFRRLAVRRFIFSNNINLCEFVPSEIVSFPSMHPSFAVSNDNKPARDGSFTAVIKAGNLVLDASNGNTPASFYIGGVNPFATYEIDILSAVASGNAVPEAGLELVRLGLRDRVQVVAVLSGANKGIYLRIYKDATLVREKKYSDAIPENAFKLRVQLYGHTLGIFTEEHGVTTCTLDNG